MDIGKVQVAVCQRRVGVLVGMWFATVPIEIVYVLVMRIMYMAMGVRGRFVGMHVLVPLGQMQPDARTHQTRG